MAVGRSAATKLEWTKVSTQLGLRGQTAAALVSFKKRNDDARRKVNLLSNTPQAVDFQHYRNTLGNTAVVDEIEQQFKSFKPATYDVNRQIKAIDTFEAQAVKSAEETKGRVITELKDMERTLVNIANARPLLEMTTDDVILARPDIEIRAMQMVSQGKFHYPKYEQTFGDLSLL